jgi:hypothetical protein
MRKLILLLFICSGGATYAQENWGDLKKKQPHHQTDTTCLARLQWKY